SDLSVGAPLPVATPSVLQVGPSDPVEATPRVKAPGDLESESLIVDESVVVRRANGLLVKPRRVGVASLNARDFRAHQARPIFEVLGTMRSPYLELPMMGNHCLQVLTTFVGRR